MEQYHRIKNQHQDAVLLFRMGDFYEMFYDDAKTANKVLGITLTSRAHGKSANVPLAGFPYHSLDGYLSKLLKSGCRVAICEQVEDPKLTKKIVKRKVIEKISPGTILSESILHKKSNNYIISIYNSNNETVGFAAIDYSTGEFFTGEGCFAEVKNYIELLSPSEVVIPFGNENEIKQRFSNTFNAVFSTIDDYNFTYDYSYQVLVQHFNTPSMKGFDLDDCGQAVSASGALLNYIKKNQMSEITHINKVRRIQFSEYMILDRSARQNLELIEGNDPFFKDRSLYRILDHSLTSMGGRKLKKWILHPLKRIDGIQFRLDGVDDLYLRKKELKDLEIVLKDVSDLERLVSKISTNKANGRDLIALKNSVKIIPEIKKVISKYGSGIIKDICKNLSDFQKLTEILEQTIVENPPISIKEGGVIKSGYNSELDELKDMVFSSKDWIVKFQKRERERTGINSLRVNFNRVFGYYIDVTKTNLDKVPDDYIRKQTLVNSERFITEELKRYEEKVISGEEKINALEYELFMEIRDGVKDYITEVQDNGEKIAVLDALYSFAKAAIENKFVKPEVTVNSEINIKAGRHPVVELYMPEGEKFIPNDITINNEEFIHIITGPNMAGKSTFIRQVGLIVLMAQIGCFIPAKSGSISVVDRIFTRVGASDRIASGESTFLVEMNELAIILNNATNKSLLLLDEIGRGTSTFDGLSIAWAAVEYIHEKKNISAKTLFATHYHELTDMERIYKGVKNYNVSVKEWGEEVIFLRKIVKGGASKSFGIHVAKMAGIPGEVIERAREILSNLEANELTPNEYPKLALKADDVNRTGGSFQITLFSPEENMVRDELKKIAPDKLTPLEALNIIYKLKKLTGKG
ncbi:DNA mismatch repair protein MutS [candidate division KSB1 bacterium]